MGKIAIFFGAQFAIVNGALGQFAKNKFLDPPPGEVGRPELANFLPKLLFFRTIGRRPVYFCHNVFTDPLLEVFDTDLTLW